MDESSVAQVLVSAHTAELSVRAVSHGLHALDERIEGIEHEAADLRWRPIMARQLGGNLCLSFARR